MTNIKKQLHWQLWKYWWEIQHWKGWQWQQWGNNEDGETIINFKTDETVW
jgi:hypothetical protein